LLKDSTAGSRTRFNNISYIQAWNSKFWRVKKAPARAGEIHLDYGMMFSGQGENSTILALKHGLMMKK
jgi:hypothetical protein